MINAQSSMTRQPAPELSRESHQLVGAMTGATLLRSGAPTIVFRVVQRSVRRARARPTLRLGDLHGAPVDLVAVERRDRRLRVGLGRHLDVSEAARLAGRLAELDRD